MKPIVEMNEQIVKLRQEKQELEDDINFKKTLLYATIWLPFIFQD